MDIELEPGEDLHNRFNKEIIKYVNRGYHVVNQTTDSASLVKPKKFYFLLFIILCFIALLPGIIYLLYFLLMEKDDFIYLYIGEENINQGSGKNKPVKGLNSDTEKGKTDWFGSITKNVKIWKIGAFVVFIILCLSISYLGSKESSRSTLAKDSASGSINATNSPAIIATRRGFTVATKTYAPQPTKQSNSVLVVPSGKLSEYKLQISKDIVINVYKKNGTLDQRQDDLKELCLDYFFYRDRGDAEGFADINTWLNAYNENDVSVMCSVVETWE